MPGTSEHTDQSAPSQGHGLVVAKLGGLVALMFVFVFGIMPPLYNLLCDLTGLNGKTGGKYVYDEASVEPDLSRIVKVRFLTNTNEGMPWQFSSELGGVKVHPGELKEVNFVVRNPTDKVMVGQAVPSLAPFNAAEHFHKTECFCFERQVLQPGEEMVMPMRFIVGRELPANVRSISLSYSLYDVTDRSDVAATTDAAPQAATPDIESKALEPTGNG